MQAIEAGPIQRLGGCGQPRGRLERRLRAECGGDTDGIAQALQIGCGLCEQRARGGGVPSSLRDLAEREAGQGGRALVPGGRLRAQGSLEQRLRPGVVVAFEEQNAAPLLGFCLARRIPRLSIQQFRLGVAAVGLGEAVQLHRQVAPRKRDARPHGRRRSRRVGDLLRAPQLIERPLQLPRRAQCAGELAPHRECVPERSGALIDGQRLPQRGPGRGVIAAAQLELAEPVQRVRRIGPLLAASPDRECVVVPRLGAPEVAARSREPGQVHEVGRGDLVAAIATIEL